MKYCKEIVDKLAHLIEEGNPQVNAASLAGISEAVFYQWLKDPRKIEFVERIKKAHSTFIESQVQIIRTAAMPRRGPGGTVVNGSWQAGAWLLERMHHDQFGMKWQGELSGKGGKPLIPEPPPIDLSDFKVEDLKTLLTTIKSVKPKSVPETNGHTNGHNGG